MTQREALIEALQGKPKTLKQLTTYVVRRTLTKYPVAQCKIDLFDLNQSGSIESRFYDDGKRRFFIEGNTV